jgi:hypothetical protein
MLAFSVVEVISEVLAASIIMVMSYYYFYYYQTISCNIPEDSHVYVWHLENLKFHLNKQCKQGQGSLTNECQWTPRRNNIKFRSQKQKDATSLIFMLFALMVLHGDKVLSMK